MSTYYVSAGWLPVVYGTLLCAVMIPKLVGLAPRQMSTMLGPWLWNGFVATVCASWVTTDEVWPLHYSARGRSDPSGVLES